MDGKTIDLLIDHMMKIVENLRDTSTRDYNLSTDNMFFIGYSIGQIQKILEHAKEALNG